VGPPTPYREGCAKMLPTVTFGREGKGSGFTWPSTNYFGQLNLI